MRTNIKRLRNFFRTPMQQVMKILEKSQLNVTFGDNEMRKQLFTLALMGFTATSFANTLKTTDLKGKAEPNKKNVFVAQKLLKAALKTKSDRAYKALLAKTRKLIAQKDETITYKAAIVAKKNGKSVNLADYEDFLESADGLCYNGDIKTAAMIAEKLQANESIWIYDEYSLDAIEIKGDEIQFKVMDEFSFSDQDAAEEDRDDYIQTYTAGKCQ